MTTAPSQPDKIRQQYESLPYPHTPIDEHPKGKDKNLDNLFIHSVVTPYYLRHGVSIDPSQLTILDAGCGSGYKALYLAAANPGAKIVGVDLSPESIRWAKQRFEYHGLANGEFHVASLEDIPALGMQYDYINCDEVLYLLPDPMAGLNAMQKVLKPAGIIRSNLHSALQRERFFRAQELFGRMGLLDDNPGELEVSIVQETMAALKNRVDMKLRAWSKEYEPGSKNAEQYILMNHLLQGDRGYQIPQLFDMLRQSDLDFLSMVRWRDWELTSLFKEADNLPAVWAMSLPGLSTEEQLYIYELIHPHNRLLDFWCTHNDLDDPRPPLQTWSLADWQAAQVSLHPLLRTAEVQQQVEEAIRAGKPFEFHKHISLPAFSAVSIDSRVMAVLLPLWQGPQSFTALVRRYQTLYPHDPVSMAPTDTQEAIKFIKTWVTKLEVFLYLLVERSVR